ncbi:uncharacterized protein LY89DRAFT_663326 [Mollisia scopiformis]|uniref:N-acetyltransferase domain-containing protein n=1 Tax=Mollisia scopiformis TaxID=149040 RepID=A0A194XWJ6_MOLSC|nr:uncharacterized protein LY89DRAFT_663326 [Mollisia scopiformis]KUJ24603.1 hypothetical protein LY89DRAFT_663326 [Mollisia scopiformis]
MHRAGPSMVRSIYPPWNNESEKAIVAVCSVRLPPDSSRIGQFQPEGPSPPPLQPDPENLNRDRDPRADKLFDQYTAEPEARLLHSKLEISTQVTHPAYWSRGHASKLAKWALEVADIDQVAAGVAAATMGVPFFSHLGFKLDELIEVKGYERHPESIKVWIGTREVFDAKPEL